MTGLTYYPAETKVMTLGAEAEITGHTLRGHGHLVYHVRFTASRECDTVEAWQVVPLAPTRTMGFNGETPK